MKYILLVALISASTYLLRLYQLVQQKGLDPTLSTFSNPMTIKEYTSYRLVLFSVFIVSLINFKVGKLALLIVLFWLLFQTLLLYIFERRDTQPVAYFIITMIGIVLLLTFNNTHTRIGFILLIILQEIYLRKWLKTKQLRYDNWVSRKVINLHEKYGYIAKEYEPKDWFKILHVAVTESIARPRLSRLAERLYWFIKRPKLISTGIMQIQSSKPMTDAESMETGSRIVAKTMRNMPNEIKSAEDQITWLAKNYNGSTKYAKYLFSTYKGTIMAWQKINQ